MKIETAKSRKVKTGTTVARDKLIPNPLQKQISFRHVKIVILSAGQGSSR